MLAAALLLAASWTALVQADTVRLVIRDGLVTLEATNATTEQILDAWSREGGVAFVNADQLASGPITVKLENVPEGEALDIILRPVSGYLARRRVTSEGSQSLFDRIVILATPAAAREGATSALPPRAGLAPVFPPPQRFGAPDGIAPRPDAEPAGIQQEPGVIRLVGADGQPVPDDQEDAPAPTQNVTPPPRTLPLPTPFLNAPPASQPPMSASPGTPGAAPVGVPVPGMIVPAPSAPGQQPNDDTTPRQ